MISGDHHIKWQMLLQQALMSFLNMMVKLITEILFKKKNLQFSVSMAKRHRRFIAGRPKTVKILKTRKSCVETKQELSFLNRQIVSGEKSAQRYWPNRQGLGRLKPNPRDSNWMHPVKTSSCLVRTFLTCLLHVLFSFVPLYTWQRPTCHQPS